MKNFYRYSLVLELNGSKMIIDEADDEQMLVDYENELQLLPDFKGELEVVKNEIPKNFGNVLLGDFFNMFN